MSPKAVRDSLLEQPGVPKEVQLNDGSRLLVRNREQWLAAEDYLIVLVGRGASHVSYRNITAIRDVSRPTRRPRGR